jgi:hypothetical protein
MTTYPEDFAGDSVNDESEKGEELEPLGVASPVLDLDPIGIAEGIVGLKSLVVIVAVLPAGSLAAKIDAPPSRVNLGRLLMMAYPEANVMRSFVTETNRDAGE